MITGHLAHWGDVAGVAMLLIANMDRKRWPVIVAGLVAYGIVGSLFIDEMTRDGSVSDLRDMTDEEKCRQARIMRDGWRGGLNDLITVLGVMVVWQTIFVCGDGRCEGLSAPIKLVRSIFADAFDDPKRNGIVSSARLLITLLTITVPTCANYVNTAAQHGQLASEVYGLPGCFDDS